MARRKSRQSRNIPGTKKNDTVESFLDIMEEGNEYQSIVGKALKPSTDFLSELIRGLEEIEKIRKRKCITYLGDVVSTKEGIKSIDATDDLPFYEMVKKAAADHDKVDVFLATGGGSGQQVVRFVNALRSNFSEVDFIIPSFCMSAGTLFALSGDNIYMTENACMGPIDPQVPTKDGRFVPAQALLLLVEELKNQGEQALNEGNSVPWTAVRIIDSIDKKEIGDAITATKYATEMATEFLTKYKFQNWVKREKSGIDVTDNSRKKRAEEIAIDLASHEKWKNHGHALSRDVLWEEIQLKIESPKLDLNRAITRFWALCTWLFDNTNILKIILSSDYRYYRYKPK